jgi:hypothetical protein
MVGRGCDDWRSSLPPDAVKEVESAIDQLKVDEDYEHQFGTVRSTLDQLVTLSRQAYELGSNLKSLSPVSIALLYDAHRGDPGSFFGEAKIMAMRSQLECLGDAAARVVDLLPELHAPGSCLEGRGSGSGRGRESDLRVVPLPIDKIVGLRSPKDRFAVAVLIALAVHQPRILEGRGSTKRAADFLGKVWQETGRRPANWDRSVRHLHYIVDWAKWYASWSIS